MGEATGDPEDDVVAAAEEEEQEKVEEYDLLSGLPSSES